MLESHMSSAYGGGTGRHNLGGAGGLGGDGRGGDGDFSAAAMAAGRLPNGRGAGGLGDDDKGSGAGGNGRDDSKVGRKAQTVWDFKDEVAEILPDGTRVLKDGTRINPDGTITLADGTVLSEEEALELARRRKLGKFGMKPIQKKKSARASGQLTGPNGEQILCDDSGQMYYLDENGNKVVCVPKIPRNLDDPSFQKDASFMRCVWGTERPRERDRENS